MMTRHEKWRIQPEALLALALSTLGVLPNSATAQHHGGHGQHHGSAHPSQYAGQETRSVASFSEDEVASHLAGRGLGYARPAELNGYPGPMHVLELKAELGLTPLQLEVVAERFAMMQDRARRAGAAYIEAETALDQAFRDKVMDLVAIKRLTLEADRLRAEKRFAHLQAHIEVRSILTEDQLQRYATLRGYGTK